MTPSEQRVLAYFRGFWAKSRRAPMLSEAGRDLSLTRQRIHQLVIRLAAQGELLDQGKVYLSIAHPYRGWKPDGRKARRKRPTAPSAAPGGPV